VTRLILGPALRYAGETEALIWVETDGPCTVSVLDCEAATFHVEGHHYALVVCDGLEPGSITPYEVQLDGETVWPEPDWPYPPSVIRTHDKARPTRIAFGSCRVCAPHEPPHSLPKDEHPDGREVDALRALAQRMARQEPADWPEAIILLGDQVYADEVSPGVRDFIRSRRDPEVPPGETVADFEEYCRLYWESWGEPYMRWLLSTVPSSMIFDDHDVHDDWNTSKTWVSQMRAQGWWDERITGGFMSYWLYQHLGNLSPRELADMDLFDRVRAADDAGDILRDYAFKADREVQGTRWSYCRDIGHARLVMVDSRAGRVLDPGRRSMVDEDEWRWIEEHARGDCEHLLIGSSLPLLLAPGMHYLEAWNEAVCDGAWGKPAAVVGEMLRQGLDLEHWAAFGRSLERMMEVWRAVGTGERGEPPATIVALSGDVHHAYLAEVGFQPGTGMRSSAWQATCSPFRNPLDNRERTIMRFMAGEVASRLLRKLAASAGVEAPSTRWRYVHDKPSFDNQVATLELDGRRALMRLEQTKRHEAEEHDDRLDLEPVFERRLA
jgi:PhoD-like phosphatase